MIVCYVVTLLLRVRKHILTFSHPFVRSFIHLFMYIFMYEYVCKVNVRLCKQSFVNIQTNTTPELLPTTILG